MLLKGLKSLVYLGCRQSSKGSGYYVTVADDENYVRYTFYSKKRYDFDKGVKVLLVLDLYHFDGKLQFRIDSLEVV